MSMVASAAPQFGYIKALSGDPLYCAYYRPPADGPARSLPVVIAPPLFEERKSAYATLRQLGAALAGGGHPVLRFDYRGSGESGGQSAARRWAHLAQDLATVRKTLAMLSGRRDSALLGLRLGATLALQETLRVGGECVVALAPVVSGAAQVRLWKMRSKIRAEMSAHPDPTPTANPSSDPSPSTGRGVDGGHGGPPHAEALDFDGYDVHPGFFDDVAAIDLIKDLAPLSCPGLLVQLSHRSEPAPEARQLAGVLGARTKLACLRMEPFWDKIDDVDATPLLDLLLQFFAAR